MKQPDKDSPRTKPVTSKPEAIKWRRQYAFWKYDQYPYVLGGEVSDWDMKGRVETVGFGTGHWFTPVKILPYDAGKALHEKLKALELEQRAAEKQFRKDWDKKLAEVFDLALLGKEPT